MALTVNPRCIQIREPNLLVPGRKPVGPVKIDRSHPLAPDELCLIMNEGTNAPQDLVSGGLLTVQEAGEDIYPAVVDGVYGLRFEGENTEPHLAIPEPIEHATSQPWCLTWVGRTFTNAGGEFDGVFIGVNNTSIDYVWMKSGEQLSVNDGGQKVISLSIPNWQSTRAYTIRFNAPGYEFWVNGQKEANSDATCASDIRIEHIGASYTSASYSFDGFLALVYIHGRAMTDQQIVDLHGNLYQFLIPA